MNQNYKPKISVIMPCFNAASYVEESVRCVMEQSYPNVELILVDDGSTDGSVKIVQRLAEEFPGRIRQFFQDHAGPYPARNQGLRHAKGEYVAFLDADDWWTRDCLEKLHAALAEHSETVVAYCGWQNVGLTGGRGEPHSPPDYELEDKTVRFLRAAAPWPIHAALVRRTAIDQAGGFDLTLPTCMDYDLWLRIAEPRPIRRVPEVLAFYRHHTSGQITSTQWRQAKNSWLVKRKFIREHPERVRHLERNRLRELVDGGLLSRGYDNFWKRDLVSARRIFRMSLFRGGWQLKDLKYLLPALLPEPLYIWLVTRRDRPA
ncbi:glycosyltransferase [Methylohalobius crimeensis]|uniref:glycosyltransferase n=1 Tax=Methylohalobius crimeensis TaxID=244365 RepID=UPI0003B54D9B|nr:glycosyltransferase [Methylohalobius crimeensis]